ncbi:PP2C family protein-serine/threonine phosphatase [Streptomyces sp. MS1.AVA.1]|uniref:PP2C family protein-serine/threonine phosphatase n=1 Tax=Streptomyces machairae TaxID=3134109 RepID=A0ABU8UV86_9ACTN
MSTSTRSPPGWSSTSPPASTPPTTLTAASAASPTPATFLPSSSATAGTPNCFELPTGTPLGVGGIPFETTTVRFAAGDRLVLYTDGLVETRHQPIDERLDVLVRLLDAPDSLLEETCDRLLHDLRHPDNHDDVALLIARAGRSTPDRAHRRR